MLIIPENMNNTNQVCNLRGKTDKLGTEMKTKEEQMKKRGSHGEKEIVERHGKIQKGEGVGKRDKDRRKGRVMKVRC